MNSLPSVTISHWRVTVFVALVILVVTAHAQTITTFDIPNSISTVPRGINSAGQITGSYIASYTNPDTEPGQSFLRQPDGTTITFGVQLGGRSWDTFASGINYSGKIVGTVFVPSSGFGFFRNTNGTIVIFNGEGKVSAPSMSATEPAPRVDCADGTAALAINARGQIAGSFGQGCILGFLLQRDGTSTLFQILQQWTAAEAINSKGDITGYYSELFGDRHGFLRHPDGTFVIFDVPNSFNTIPQAINHSGQIAGYYHDASGQHAFLRQPDGTFITFDPPGSISTQVTALNTKGEITGFYETEDGRYHGFVRHRKGAMESFDVVGEGYAGTFPKDINDRGQIVGYYQDANFALHGFIRSAR